ncbi:FGGY-family carbohydrate kinase [uncultured Shimia sp.]|uniref:FGGY-family carbohydrate kinase n=1 Tax=uncultured Shimia sp. TaxID=573152 RepID=UPI002617E7C7|nr:FGGY-family carbohydrate kinase [uncultured Shimia sp.]
MTDLTMARKNVAVIDVGKTNAKLALVDGNTLTEVAVVTRPNTVIPGPPYPHFDLEGHWQFFLEALKAFNTKYGIDAISITTHGASIVLLQADGTLATPMLDYEFDGPNALAEAYDKLRPPFSETGSPRLAGGLNVGAQLHWLLKTDPALLSRTEHVITYPQYWGFRLTGNMACDVTSLGCHTDLWNPWKRQPSSLPARLGISEKLAASRRSSEVLGTVSDGISRITGLPDNTPVLCGIHDSNASLVPYLNHDDGPTSVVSTGTWVICMALGSPNSKELDSDRDTLVNVNALGEPVPSARFMGGREYEIILNGSLSIPTDEDRREVHEKHIMLLPSVVSESGPFRGQSMSWSREPKTDGQKVYALSLYLALMTDFCLGLIGGTGATVVEGPFAKNGDYVDMLMTLRERGVATAKSATGTSVGAAMLYQELASPNSNVERCGSPNPMLLEYARKWQSSVTHCQ